MRLHALHAQPRRRLSLLETPFGQSLPTTRKTTAPHGGGPLRRGLLPRRRLPHRRTALPRGVQGPGQGRTFAAGDGNRARRPWPHRRAFRLAPRRHGVVRVHAAARPALHGRMRPDIGRQGAALRSARGQRLHLRPARRAQRHLLRRIRPFGQEVAAAGIEAPRTPLRHAVLLQGVEPAARFAHLPARRTAGRTLPDPAAQPHGRSLLRAAGLQPPRRASTPR